jgi:hypothetical protein
MSETMNHAVLAETVIFAGKYIRFEKGPPKAKTLTWFVVNKESGEAIGEIKWYGPWRRYSFFPFPETVYESDCLKDIGWFLIRATATHKTARLAGAGGAVCCRNAEGH